MTANDMIQSNRSAAIKIFEAGKQDGRPVHVAAPMVRYSKLPFRLLLLDYGVDIVYTPMILAHEFNRSSIARDSDFTTNALEQHKSSPSKSQRRPHALIAQFAASEPQEFARAAELIAPFVDGVDLNCGCPQSWALREGIGCSLMAEPDKVAEMVRMAKERLPKSKSVSVKIRIHKDLDETRRWLAIVQRSGVDYITVHGRLRSQRSSTPPDYAAIRSLRTHITVPMLANGDAYSATDVAQITKLTQADGVMAARGLLENPALFAGYEVTPVECVRRFLEWTVQCPIPFPLVLHHVVDMTTKMEGMTKRAKKAIMECADLVDLVDYVEARWPES